jgi:rhamnulose-1-phosphate aldolase
MIIEQADVDTYLKGRKVIRTIPMGFDASAIKGKYIIVTGTGKYFKNVKADPETNLGIIRIADNGTDAELVWGYKDGGKFTSELPAHLMSHISRLAADDKHRVVMHSHPTYTIAMNAVCPIDEKEFTHRLWQSNTESIVVFPDGVGVLPCMVCGTNEIGIATAEKMAKTRLVVWTNHGIYGTGKTMDEAFGLIETVEKTAQIYMLTLGHVVNVIPDSIIKALADLWHLTPVEGILDC